MAVWWLALALIVMTILGCDYARADRATEPHPTAPADWARRHGYDTGSPGPGTPQQQAPNQHGAPPATPAEPAASPRG